MSSLLSIISHESSWDQLIQQLGDQPMKQKNNTSPLSANQLIEDRMAKQKVTQIGELHGTALQLELVTGEGLEPVLEGVLQRPSKNRLHRSNP